MNPIAADIARARLSDIQLDLLAAFRLEVKHLSGTLFADARSDWQRDVPNFQEQSRWYHPATLFDLARLRSLIAGIESDKRVALVAEVCFSSSLLACSSQDKHWGWVCDNVYPERLVYRDAISEFLGRLDLFVAVAEGQRAERALYVSGTGSTSTEPDLTDVVCGDSRQVLSALPDASFDAVVTSPPYFGVIDYVASQRLSLLWSIEYFVRGRSDPKPSWYRVWRSSEIGARFTRGTTAGSQDYIAAVVSVVEQCQRLVVDDGLLAFVLGASTSRTPLAVLVSELEASGLTLRFDHVRSIPTQRQLSPRVGSERILVFSKD